MFAITGSCLIICVTNKYYNKDIGGLHLEEILNNVSRKVYNFELICPKQVMNINRRLLQSMVVKHSSQ